MKPRCNPSFPLFFATATLAGSSAAVEVTYQYYRFTPVKLKNDSTNNSIQISEFNFLLAGSPVSRAGVVVTNPGGDSPAGQGPELLIDGATGTKWLDRNKGQLIFDFGAAVTIDGYRFSTANDNDNRDPVRWIFEGSTDGTTWWLLDHQHTDFPTPAGRQATTSDILLPASPVPHRFTWTGAISGDWNAAEANWDQGIWNNSDLLHARFNNVSPLAVTLTEPLTLRKIEAAGSPLTLQGGSLTFSSIRGTGAGSTTIESSGSLTISTPIVGGGGWTKKGPGLVTLTGANTYTAPTFISEGTVTYADGGSFNTPTSSNLRVGASHGRGALHLSANSLYKFGGTRLGGDDISTHTGQGVIRQTAGDATFANAPLEMGVGVGAGGALSNTYGGFFLEGGKTTITINTRIGTGGLGNFHQSGGEYVTGSGNTWFAIGASTGAASFSTGTATFTGGTATPAGTARILLCDRENSTATLNIGTLAGGSAVVTTNNTGGPAGSSVAMLATATGLSATLNLNSGTLRFNGGGIARNGTTVGKTAVVNLNGGTLQYNSAVPRDILSGTNGLVTTLYNGGLTVDTQAFEATISANLVHATGSGIYPAGGVVSQPSPSGSGYIGAPLVTVSTSGSGTGATALANVANGEVTGVTITCPGQGYAAGDTITFTYAGGGPLTAAPAFDHVLAAGDLAPNGGGGLVKLGGGRLNLTGTTPFSGPLSVAGSLHVNQLSLGGGPLSFTDFAGTVDAPLQVQSDLTTTGPVTVSVEGSYGPGVWPLIFYPVGGSIGGNGFSAFQLDPNLPRGVVAQLEHNTANSSVDLNVLEVNSLAWRGNAGAAWDVNATANWVLGAATEVYLNDDVVLFDDSATGTTSVALNTIVSPRRVTFNNDASDYTIAGSGGIGGTGTLVKTGTGKVTLLTANAYTGATTVDAGILQLGDGNANGGIAGPLVNHDTVIFHPAGTATHAGPLSGSGAGLFSKVGPGTQVITSTTNTSTGGFVIEDGVLQFGNGSVNGATGGMYYFIDAAGELLLQQATAAGLPTGFAGAGKLVLDSAQPVNGSANWGAVNASDSFTGEIQVANGRIQAANEASLGGTSKIEILAGAQFLGFTSVDPYQVPIEIAGDGWGENGYPGGLRLAADSTATWAGSVTLTADSGIMAQRGANFTVTGAITGPHQATFHAGDPVGDSGNLIVHPDTPGQNTYASTRIDGRPNGAVIAGSAQAFSTGPLIVGNATLKLNGHSHSFASLSGAGGAIGNDNATPATLSVGADGSTTSYAGVLRDGTGSAPLSFVKAGTGTLTLGSPVAYTGATTVAQGTLVLSSASLDDASTVTIQSGAVLRLDTGASDTVGTLILGGVTVGSGTYNAAHPVYGSYFAGNGSLTIGGASYDTWAASKGLTGEDAEPGSDPDHDGISNLVEFYLDGNPLASDPSILPAATLDATHLTLSFQRRDDAEADVLTQSVQYGSDLAAWATVPLGAASATDGNGVIVTIEENATDPDDISVRIPRALAGGGRFFARMNITR